VLVVGCPSIVVVGVVKYSSKVDVGVDVGVAKSSVVVLVSVEVGDPSPGVVVENSVDVGVSIVVGGVSKFDEVAGSIFSVVDVVSAYAGEKNSIPKIVHKLAIKNLICVT
jgi:hypothetical protein